MTDAVPNVSTPPSDASQRTRKRPSARAPSLQAPTVGATRAKTRKAPARAAALTSALPPEAVAAMVALNKLLQAVRSESPDLAEDHARRAEGRIEQHSVRARKARDAAKHSPRLAALGPAPTRSPREDELAKELLPPSGPRGRADAGLAATLKEVTSNPLWLAADHVACNPGLLKVEDLLRKSTVLAEAKAQYRTAEERFVRCQRALRAFERRPAWQRAALRLVSSREATLRTAHDQAAHGLVQQKGALDHVTQEERWRVEDEVRSHNSAALARQTEARAIRDEMEEPLRSAALDRHIAQEAQSRNLAISKLRDLRGEHTLTYAGERKLGSFEFLELREVDGRVVMVDKLDPAAGHGKLELVRGDQVRVRDKLPLRRSNDGPLRDKGLQLGDAPLVGEVGALAWNGNKLEGLELRSATGESRWVMPRGVDGDLTKELGAAKALKKQLRTGDHVRLSAGSLSILGSSRAVGAGLGH